MPKPVRPVTAAEAAALAGGALHGCPSGRELRGARTLAGAQAGDLSFLHHPKYLAEARESRAGLILVSDPAPLEGKPLLVVKDPYRALALILAKLYAGAPATGGISPLAAVDPSAAVDPAATVHPFAFVGARARVAARAVIQPFAFVGPDCSVGEDAAIHPHAVLCAETEIGPRSIIHGGAVLGADGFGFVMGAGGHLKIPQVGRVRVGADVEIGANSTVDRAALDETVIEDGAKIDNLVMIAHNVVVGKHSVLVAQSGIAGSTTLGPGVIVAGQSGAVGHVTLGAGAKVGAKSAVTRDLAPGEFVTGHPARPHREWLAQQAMIDKLPELRKQLRELGAKVEALENRISGPGTRAALNGLPGPRTPDPGPSARKPARVKKNHPAKRKPARAKQ